MAGFGSTSPFPRRFGGGLHPREAERIALASSFRRDGYDPDEPTKAAEALAFATPIATVWAVNERNRGAEIPARMMETLPSFEELLRITPDPAEGDGERRTAVAAKLRGISGQATSEDIEDVCAIIMGSSFEGLARVDPTDEIAYWPAINPGRPGFEWTSNRCVIGIKIRRGTQDDALWARLLARLYDLLQTLLPAWEVFVVGQHDGGFVMDLGKMNTTAL